MSSKYLSVICPVCGAFKGKECRHTKGSRKGKKREDGPHGDRVKLAKVKISQQTRHDFDEEKPKKSPKEKLTSDQKKAVETILEKIEVLGKHAEFVGPVSVGPVITTYRFLPVKRTKVNHLEQLHKDFAVALGAEAVLVKRMPGESAVGIFVPNKDRKPVDFPETLTNVVDYLEDTPEDGHKPIPVNLGIDSNGDPVVDDLTQQPHMLIAGTTGSGKSTCEHAIALSMLWTMSPKEVQIIISDTKAVEFKEFGKTQGHPPVPHLKFPICTSVYMTMEALNWCCKETQIRLNLFAEANVRNIHEYNAVKTVTEKLPYIVILIDELADVIAVGPEVDNQEAKVNASKLSTIVARSRASGIHVIAATQRPSVNIVKGSIKANFPTRLAFKLPSSADSKTVLTTKGAESLMRKGDALYSSSTTSDLRRIHAPYAKLDVVRTTVEGIIQRHQSSMPVEKTGVPSQQEYARMKLN